MGQVVKALLLTWNLEKNWELGIAKYQNDIDLVAPRQCSCFIRYLDLREGFIGEAGQVRKPGSGARWTWVTSFPTVLTMAFWVILLRKNIKNV